MNKLIYSFVLLCLGISFSSNAQILEHHLGEFLIKTQHPIEKVMVSHQYFEGERTSLELKRKVAPVFNIYLVQFDHGTIHEDRFLKELKKNPLIEVVQYNHIISYRATPNDTQFADQWQYINTGQSGGTAGADIDADLAWDITTGGVTALGDTIVAAIIDDGLDWTHSDFGDNIWVNYAEIPNNGIDDDNNGYVDDYQGWNAYNNNDNITGGWHGSPVAGIVGAQGNNNNGVAGVNWDVKLMIIQGGGGEADALAAYAYCYTQRKRYNETAGAEGAFVVTTNASWGVDFGQPADAPLWCSFYDTLGMQGIMSCGATINGDQNVDVVGDLPTACPSDWLISVTNMNDNDVKVTQAGYGATTIDLGAFGADTWTIAQGNSYGGFGGTSGATPHVTGTVALMYSVPCPSFAAFAKADPAAAALLTKQYILDGVDPNASLDGITVTGGRLNVFNAVNAMMTNCDPNGCFTPYSLQVENVLDVSADLVWSVGDDTDQSDIRYREVGTMTWTDLPNITSPHSLTGLTPCTEYEFQALAICDGVATDWSNPITFQTDGCCEPPSELTIDNITDNSATINWSSVLAAESYDIQYKETSSAMWMNANVVGTTFSLTNLSPCTSYEVQIQTNCAGGVNTGFTSSYTFSTSGCGACVDGNYCPSIGGDSSLEWIESVSLNTINNTSGNDDGYANYTNFSTDLEVDMTYDITLEPGFDGYPYDEYFMVWIDYNQDGDFDDADEVVYDPGNTTQNAITGNFTVPTDALAGPTRMRVTMRWNETPTSCQQTFDYGEVEDYCVNIINNNNPDCPTPSNITSQLLVDNTIQVNWDEVANGIGYEVRYREITAIIWEGDVVSTPVILIPNLEECKEFEIQIKTICAIGTSIFSPVFNFSSYCPPSCDPPTNISTSNIMDTTVDISWDAMANASSYDVEYRIVGGTWSMTSSASENITLNNLDDCNDYEFKVRTNCDGNSSDFSSNQNFTTTCTSSNNNIQEIPFKIYPNPVSDELIIEIDNILNTEIQFQLSDISGKIIQRGNITQQNFVIDMSSLPSSIYFIQLRSEEKTSIQKIIKLKFIF